jgi:hypothetical protein
VVFNIGNGGYGFRARARKEARPGMTAVRCGGAISQHVDARVVAITCPSEIRGRRESRVRNAPAASRANDRKHTSQSPQVHRNNPAFPAQWFTAYIVLSSVTGLVCHRRLAEELHKT